eukprot:75001-Pelagomonas_calceolata.AAC.3
MLGESIKVGAEKSKVTITSDIHLSKRWVTAWVCVLGGRSYTRWIWLCVCASLLGHTGTWPTAGKSRAQECLKLSQKSCPWELRRDRVGWEAWKWRHGAFAGLEQIAAC